VLEDIPTPIPHMDFGAPDCCGCLTGRIVGDRGEIFCNECAEIVRAVPAADLQRALDDMESQLEVATGLCEHCGSVNLFPGLSRVEAAVSIPVIALRWKATVNRETVRELWLAR
jgi:hypothetical protein